MPNVTTAFLSSVVYSRIKGILSKWLVIGDLHGQTAFKFRYVVNRDAMLQYYFILTELNFVGGTE